jgi:hypothetical protein
MSQHSYQNNNGLLDSQRSLAQDSPTIGRTQLQPSSGSQSSPSDSGSYRYVGWTALFCSSLLNIYHDAVTGLSARLLPVLYKLALRRHLPVLRRPDPRSRGLPPIQNLVPLRHVPILLQLQTNLVHRRSVSTTSLHPRGAFIIKRL